MKISGPHRPRRQKYGAGFPSTLALALVLALVAGACTNHPTTATGGSTPPPTVAASVKLVDAVKQSCPEAITATCLSVGNISTISGIIPGLFEGAAVGTDAYLSYLDST